MSKCDFCGQKRKGGMTSGMWDLEACEKDECIDKLLKETKKLRNKKKNEK